MPAQIRLEAPFDVAVFGLALLTVALCAGFVNFLFLYATADEIDMRLESFGLVCGCGLAPVPADHSLWNEAVLKNVLLWIWLLPAALMVEWKLRKSD